MSDGSVFICPKMQTSFYVDFDGEEKKYQLEKIKLDKEQYEWRCFVISDYCYQLRGNEWMILNILSVNSEEFFFFKIHSKNALFLLLKKYAIFFHK